MPRHGELIRLPDGTAAFIDYSGPPRKPCSFCAKPSTLLCDYPLESELNRNGIKGSTCDKPLCESCALRPRPGKDYCPDHGSVRSRMDQERINRTNTL